VSEARPTHSASQSGAMSDQARVDEINLQLAALRAQISPLVEEREKLLSEQARLEYPDGPFTLHVWRHFAKYEDEYDRPLEALYAAEAIEGDGSGSTEKIVDRHGNVIYDLDGYPPERIAEGYPEVPDDL
jgi:hypothetical protein